eukprot:CAMPEP_0116044182 /NCGR_PEP_ID=MMETSP0321-20121206/26853_1 /TAXON_ID=163516 /ORGANISM="Leptocylindrus danicus var. danicus, Strain B650" /LENGTH=340 /DNA_ID=CAMNT_0003525241 /DNA_START=190 /DNA_END=1209 /DNA_ORIENTATION=-
MTHVLNAALRKTLAESNSNVEQRGSLCNDEKLRFDFSHKKALSLKELQQVEAYVNDVINDNLEVTNQILPLEEAQALPGVVAVFGEVYPDPVRVVSVSDEVSIEFCGGTHLSNTKEAGAFVLVEETAVAKGIRRITGVTGEIALEAQQRGLEMKQMFGNANKNVNLAELRKELDAAFISTPLKIELRSQLEVLQKKAAEKNKAALNQRIQSVIADLTASLKEKEKQKQKEQEIIVQTVDIGADGKASNKVLDALRKVAPNTAFLGISEEEVGSGGKVLCFAVVPQVMIDDNGMNASDWINETLKVIGGRGGGRPANAQGQAPQCTSEDVALLVQAANAYA